MADKKLEIILSAKNTSEKVFKNLNTQMSTLKKSVLGLASAYGVLSLKNAIKDWVTLAGYQQEAVAGMTQAMESMGRYTGEFKQKILDTATSLQKMSTFGDEAIIMGAKFLMTYEGIGNDVMPRVMETMTDLAALMKGDFTSAANMLGKASMGMTGELRRVGITVDQDTFKIKGFLGVLEQIEKQVAGQAKALASTGIGPWKQLSNIWSDSKEDLGELVLTLTKDLNPSITVFAEQVGIIARYWAEMFSAPTALDTLKAQRDDIVKELTYVDQKLANWSLADAFFGKKEIFEKRQKELETQLRTVLKSIQTEMGGVTSATKEINIALVMGTDMWNKWGSAAEQAMQKWAAPAYGFNQLQVQAEEVNTVLTMGTDMWNKWGNEAEKAMQKWAPLAYGFNQPQEQFKEVCDTMISLSQRTADAMESNFSDFFFDVMTGEFTSLKDTATGVFESISRAMSDYMGQWLTQGLFGEAGGGTGAGWLSALFASLSASAKGNVFSASRLVPFASGGIVDRPTIFPMATGAGLMGEKGPEAVMPLTRLPGGGPGGEVSRGRRYYHKQPYHDPVAGRQHIQAIPGPAPGGPGHVYQAGNAEKYIIPSNMR